MRVILIAGLPGSGKTCLGKKLSLETGFPFIDDISVQANQTGLTLNDLLPENIDGLIVSDVPFCEQEVRKQAEQHIHQRYPQANIQWISFENDAESCLWNVLARNDGRLVREAIHNYSRTYQPEGTIFAITRSLTCSTN